MQSMPATERQPTQMDIVIKSLYGQLDSLNDTIGGLEDKVSRLDIICNRVHQSLYLKNQPEHSSLNESINKVSAHPDRDGLMGEFDKLGARLEFLNKRLSNDFSQSLIIVVDHLEKHI